MIAPNRALLLLLVLGRAALALPAHAQVGVPACPAGDSLLLVAKDEPAQVPVLRWSGDCENAVKRSLDVLFPGPAVDLLLDPLTDDDTGSLRDGAPPPGLVFYRLDELDSGWDFWEACRRSDTGLETAPLTLAYDNGTGIGYVQNLSAGDVEAVHFIPRAPLLLQAIRLRFAGAPGPVEVHLWADFGRSWPDEAVDLIPPIVLPSVDTTDWTTLDISAFGLQIHPRDHFWVGYVHQADQPWLFVDDGASPSHSRIKDPDTVTPPFVWSAFASNNFLVRVDAEAFCEVTRPAFADRSAEVGFDLRHESRVAWGDANGDRFDDLLLDGRSLLLNDRARGFDDVTDSSGLGAWDTSSGFAVFGDVDNDRDQDLYVAVYTNQDPAPVPGDPQDAILLNRTIVGFPLFTPVAASGVGDFATTSGAAFGDFDADGKLDLYVGAWLLQYPQIEAMPDTLFRGNGDGTFADVTDAFGMSGQGPVNMPCYGVATADYDDDGDLDIFVGNYGRQPNFLWENQHAQGTDGFLEVADSVGLAQDLSRPGGGNTFGEDWGDFDGDGDLDLFMTEIAHPRYLPTSDISSLQVNSGPPDYRFTDERADRAIHYDEGGMEASWIDYDNDGDLDLMISYLYTFHHARLYRQEADGRFTDVTYEAGIDVHDATNHAWADHDRDGDLDLAITSRGGGSHVWLFDNLEGNAGHWLTVRLEGQSCGDPTPGLCNCSGIGARVFVTAGGRTQIRELQGGKGHFNSQPSLPVEFGLGDATAIDELRVRWPCGAEETYAGAEVDRFVLVQEGAASVTFE